MSVAIKKKDEIIMRLVHYFVTEENYQPLIVNGVKNEIWLENLDAPYRIIRINSNYIHNEDQLQFDKYKIQNIMKQIKKKTFSIKMNTLNLLLDLNEDVKIDNDKDIESYKIDSVRDLRSDNGISKIFPKLKTFSLHKEDNADMIINITNDINNKTESQNKEFEKVFKPKKIIVTNILIAINVIMYILTIIFPSLLYKLVLDPTAISYGEYYRLITCIFLHGNIFHLALNMYALYIIGNQVETFLGKTKYAIIYLVSGLTGSMLSYVLSHAYSLGASGAIFGLMGCLLYFGYHYRLYLGNVLLSQLIPIILINLMIGFMYTGIDNFAHIGGLVGGLFLSMALGLGKKTDKVSRINGIITSSIYIIFLIVLVLMR